jgi:hypothetical protein
MLEFGPSSETEGISSRYAEILKEQKRKYTEWVECPSRFEPESKEPLCMTRETKRFNAGGSVKGTFDHGIHTPWETF